MGANGENQLQCGGGGSEDVEHGRTKGGGPRVHKEEEWAQRGIKSREQALCGQWEVGGPSCQQ